MDKQKEYIIQLQRIKQKLSTYSEDDEVMVRISFIYDAIERLSIDKKYNQLYENLLEKKEKLELLTKLERDYIRMSVEEFSYLFDYTLKFGDMDRRMMVIFSKRRK